MKFDKRALRKLRQRGANSPINSSHTDLFFQAIDMLGNGAGTIPDAIRRELQNKPQADLAGLKEATFAVDAFLHHGGDWTLRLCDLEAIAKIANTKSAAVRSGISILQALALANEPSLSEADQLRDLINRLKTQKIDAALAATLKPGQTELHIPARVHLALHLWLLTLAAKHGLPLIALAKNCVNHLETLPFAPKHIKSLIAIQRAATKLLANVHDPAAKAKELDKLLTRLESNKNNPLPYLNDEHAQLGVIYVWLFDLLASAVQKNENPQIATRVNNILKRWPDYARQTPNLLANADELAALDIDRNGKPVLQALAKLSDLDALDFVDRLRVEIIRVRSLIAQAAEHFPRQAKSLDMVHAALRRLKAMLEHGVPSAHQHLCQALMPSFVTLYVTAADKLHLFKDNFDDTLQLLKAFTDDARLATLAVGGALLNGRPHLVKFLAESPARSAFDFNLFDKLLAALKDAGIWRPLNMRDYLLAGLARDQLRQIYFRCCAWSVGSHEAFSLLEQLDDYDRLVDLFDMPTLVWSDLESGAELDCEMVFFAALHGRKTVKMTSTRKNEFLRGAVQQLQRRTSADTIVAILRQFPKLWSDGDSESMLLGLCQLSDPRILQAAEDWIEVMLRQLRHSLPSTTPALCRIGTALRSNEMGRYLWRVTAPTRKRVRTNTAAGQLPRQQSAKKPLNPSKKDFWDEHFN